MGGLLHLVQRWRAWEGCGPAHSFPSLLCQLWQPTHQRSVSVNQLHIIRWGTIQLNCLWILKGFNARFRVKCVLLRRVQDLWNFDAPTRPDWQAEAPCSQPVCLFVCPSVTKTGEHDIFFWKRMKRFRCQRAQLVHRAMAWKDKLWGSGGQRQGHTTSKLDLEVFGRVGFLCFVCRLRFTNTNRKLFT